MSRTLIVIWRFCISVLQCAASCNRQLKGTWVLCDRWLWPRLGLLPQLLLPKTTVKIVIEPRSLGVRPLATGMCGAPLDLSEVQYKDMTATRRVEKVYQVEYVAECKSRKYTLMHLKTIVFLRPWWSLRLVVIFIVGFQMAVVPISLVRLFSYFLAALLSA